MTVSLVTATMNTAGKSALSPSASAALSSLPSPSDDRPVTILEDAANFNIKHPLQYTWNLWLKDGSAGTTNRPGRSGTPSVVVTSGNWKEQLQDIDAISTVEDFWGIPKASTIAEGSDYFLFKEGISPEWEDAAHLQGGSLTCNLPRGAPGTRWQFTDDCWLNAMMACVGCQFQLHGQVTGVQFACRERGSRIILWMRTVDHDLVQCIREDLSKALQEGLPDLGSALTLNFDNFTEKKAKSSAPRRTSSARDTRDSGHSRDSHRDAPRRYF